MRRILLFLSFPSLCALVCPTAAQQAVRDGLMEKLVLDGFEQELRWSASEASVTRDTQRVKDGQASMRLHIGVDHLTGEPKYPVGWPRANRALSEPWQRNWSGWDFFQFWIYATTSRPSFPSTPLSLILHTPDKASAYNRVVAELKKDEWVQVRVPLGEIARHSDVRLIQFAISESNYKHGDQLDFYLDDVALTRYAEPVVDLFAAERHILLSAERWLPVHIRLLGVNEGQTEEVRFDIRSGQGTVASAVMRLPRGEQRLWVDLGQAGLAEGEYGVAAALGARAVADPVPIRVIPGPWGKEEG